MNHLITLFSNAINYFNTNLHLTHIVTIILISLLLKIIISPIKILFLINQEKKSLIDKKIDQSLDKESFKKTKKKIYKDNKLIHPLILFILFCIQLTITLSFIQTLYQLNTIKNTKYLWFTLGEKDSLFILPIILILTIIIEKIITKKIEKDKIGFLDVFVIIFISIIALNVWSTIIIYWITANIYSLLIELLIIKVSIKKKCNIKYNIFETKKEKSIV